MCGNGTRTSSRGPFKPFVLVCGQPMAKWFLMSIKRHLKQADSLVFITTDYFDNTQNVKSGLSKIISECKINCGHQVITVESIPRGESSTVLSAKPAIDLKKPAAVINPDQFANFDLPRLEPGFAYLAVQVNLGTASAFITTRHGLVDKCEERRKISDVGSASLFVFQRAYDLFFAVESQLKHDGPLAEHYIGDCIKYLIRSGTKVRVFFSDTHDLGTIEGIQAFEEMAKCIKSLA